MKKVIYIQTHCNFRGHSTIIWGYWAYDKMRRIELYFFTGEWYRHKLEPLQSAGCHGDSVWINNTRCKNLWLLLPDGHSHKGQCENYWNMQLYVSLFGIGIIIVIFGLRLEKQTKKCKTLTPVS